MPSPQRLKKVLTVANVQNQAIQRVPFGGDWYQAFKRPQNRGVWFVWGSSGSGKSTFLMQLAKQYAHHGKVLYNLLEEEPDDSDYIERTQRCAMNEVESNFFTQTYNYDELNRYLERRNSPDTAIIDSATYLTKDFKEYYELKKRFKNKTLIFSGHAQGKEPRTEFEKSIMYDAKMKIYISGYAAYCKGRTIGPNGGVYIIYPDGYEKLQGVQNN